MSDIGPTGKLTPHNNQAPEDTPRGQEGQSKGHTIKKAEKAPDVKQVRCDEDFLKVHGEGGQAHKRKRKNIRAYATQKSIVGKNTEALRHRIMLDALCKGSPADLEMFKREFVHSQCSNDHEQLKALAASVSQSSLQMTSASLQLFLKTYMEAKVATEMLMVLSVGGASMVMGKTDEWMRNLELERLRKLSIEGFSSKDIAVAMQARAEEIADFYQLPLPEDSDWQSLPSVTDEIYNPLNLSQKAEEKQKKAKQLAELMQDEVEEIVRDAIIKQMKPAFDKFVAEGNFSEEEKEMLTLNTLEDIVYNLEDGQSRILDTAKRYVEDRLPSHNFRTVTSRQVAHELGRLLEAKYPEPPEPDKDDEA